MNLSLLGAGALAVFPLFVWLTKGKFWISSTAVEFSPHAIATLMLIAVCALVSARHILSVSAGIAMLIWTAQWILLSGPALASDAPASGSIKAIGVNALTSNGRPEDLARWIRSESPDLVVVVETTPRINRALEALGDLYPWRAQTLRTNLESPGFVVCGITILSRFPLRDHGVIEPIGREDRPLAWARIAGPQGELILAGMHPPPPHWRLIGDRSRYLFAGMQELAEIANGLPVLAIGDFNATPWSSAFANRPDGWRIISPGGATWPIRLGFVGIPIDLAAVHGELAFAGSEIGPDIGSDHSPVIWHMAPTSALGPTRGDVR